MSSNTVHVKNISHQTSENEVREFFSFCGKITSLSVTPASNDPESTKSATVTFEKDTAAKTALLLDNTQLGPSSVQVSGAPGLDEIAPGKTATEPTQGNSGELDQEDKPRSRIIAEYLAHGYVIGDNAIQKAIELDKKHGFSHKFTSALHNFENKYRATDRARSMDTAYGVSDKANAGWRSLSHYFEKALGTPTGQRVRLFYTHSEKQALDIHNEALRLANLRKADTEPAPAPQGTEKTTCKCGSISEQCTCPPGRCGCSDCPKVDLKLVEGTMNTTTCSCGGNGAICPCTPGLCACSNCPKATEAKKQKDGQGICNCGGNAASCTCEPGTCNCAK